jgi:hypothetical protein
MSGLIISLARFHTLPKHPCEVERAEATADE